MKLDEHKPIPCRISDWDSMTEIIYCCQKCGQNFNFYSNKELFCHHCGNEINWDCVPIHCSKEFSEDYFNCDNNDMRTELLYKLYKGERL